MDPRAKRFEHCIDPDFERLMAEQDPKDPKDPNNRFEEINTISAGVNVEEILNAQQTGGRRLPSGAWQAVTFDSVRDDEEF